MFKQSLAGAPAPWFVTALGSTVALVTAFAKLSPAETAALYSLAAAGGTLITAARTRPVAVAAIAGAASVILGDLTIFGFPALSADQKGAVVGVLTFVLGAFLHLIHEPVAAAPVPGAQPPASP